MVQHIASVDGGVEAAIDAPWRLEPDFTGSPIYPAIPIVVSIHDTVLQSDPETARALGRICEMTIHEEGAPTAPGVEYTEQFPAFRFTEIERSDKWPNGTEAARNHRLCRLWAGETCTDFDLDVGASAEWHGTVHYTPRQQTPGADVRLTVQVRVARAGQECSAPKPFLAEQAGLFDRLGPDPSGSGSFVIVNRLIVHLGEEPLPRFDRDWVYGDLHYHSQGTDNEGESAIAYRPTLQAMRAIGLDFAFATEHASAGSSGQITDVDEIFVDLENNVPDYWWVPDDIEEWVRSFKIRIGAQTRSEAARDMNSTRFAAMRAVLNDPPNSNPFFPTGANADVMKVPGRAGAARLFLGGEVDVIPEMSAAEQASGMLGYGNGLGYYWRNACSEYPAFLDQAQEWTTMTICNGPDELGDEPTFEGDRYKIQDVQAFGDPSYYARQHLVHLPIDGTRDDAFVASDTSIWGGATRRLGPATARPGEEAFVDGVLYRDYELGRKGYAFLAHPVDGASGRGMGRLGPDIVPYSDVQLETAFSSPWVLGLQLWNEDTRLSSGGTGAASIQGFPLQYFDDTGIGKWLWARWNGREPNPGYWLLHSGMFAWDKMLLWGIRSSRTAQLSWLLAGEPRRVFMAGGSDAHGDLNYRREGRLGGVTGIVDTAIGKPRNLLYVGPTRAESVTSADGAAHGAVGQEQVTSALATGNFAITDGPALRVAVDLNVNGVIDAGDVPMGGVVHNPYKGAYVPVLVEWKSTDEFGPIAGIDLYVGAASDALDDGLVYAPAGHGVHAYPSLGEVKPNAWVDAAGVSHYELKDNYMLDPSGRLHITPSAGEAKAGTRRVYLRADDFVVGWRRVNQPEQTCEYKCINNGRYCEMKCSTPPPTYHFDSVTPPDRIYVRAFARTAREAGAICNQAPQNYDEAIAQRTGQCIERLAFTNPIWVDNLAAPPPPGDFSVRCSPTSINVFYPGTGAVTCTVESTGGFARAVSLACDGLPATASCTNTTVAPPANGSVDVVMTVSATRSTAFGTFPIRVRGTSRDELSGLDVVRDSADVTLIVGNPNPPPPVPPVTGPIAEWDWLFEAPSCALYGSVSSCDTDRVVINRGRFEPSTPNTIGSMCGDGWMGGQRSVNRIRVKTVDGSPFAAGALVRVDAVVVASTRPLMEAVDIFVTADASAPVWSRVATKVPQWAYSQTVTATFELPAGNRHAVRVQYRTGADDGDCAAGASNDRDDLILDAGTP